MNLETIRTKCAELAGTLRCPGCSWERLSCENHGHEVPNYPASADAALELVAWMSKPENGQWVILMNNSAGTWEVFLTSKETMAQHVVSADTLPLAICKAFLEANGIDPETP